MPEFEQAEAIAAQKENENAMLLDTFKQSLQDCFGTMFGLNVSYIETPPKTGKEIEAVASLGLVGAIEAAFTLGFPKNSAYGAVTAMMGGMEPESIEEVCDGIGEIANIVAGGAKTRLEGTDYHFTLSIPSVVLGHSLKLKSQQTSQIFRQRCTFGDGHTMQMSLIMEKKSKLKK